MNRWFVKGLAKITGVSVQTLHHYDHIGLLKPSFHTSKGYRVYGEAGLIEDNLSLDPKSQTSMALAARVMEMINNLYGNTITCVHLYRKKGLKKAMPMQAI